MTAGGRRVTFSRHAREQMIERRISQAQIERTLNAPSRLYSSFNPRGRIIAERVTQMGNTLRVVYVELATAQGMVSHVVTVIRIGERSP